MSTGTINLSLAPSAWARLNTNDLLDLGRRIDASSVSSLLLEDPDAHDAPGPWRWDSSTAIGALVAVTDRVRLILPISSSYTDPFSASRRVGSLDNLSAGRVGWLLDPSVSPSRSQRTRAVSPDLGVEAPAERAAELVSASRALWDSWDDEALLLDAPGNRLVDETRIHPVAFSGRHFKLNAQTNLRRPPSGNPPLYWRVKASDDVGAAAALADVVLAASVELADATTRAASEASRANPPKVLLSAAAGSSPASQAFDGQDLLVSDATQLASLLASTEI